MNSINQLVTIIALIITIIGLMLVIGTFIEILILMYKESKEADKYDIRRKEIERNQEIEILKEFIDSSNKKRN